MAVIKFDSPSGSATNTSSCSPMVTYLEKEDQDKGIDKEFFFNQRNDMVPGHVVKTEIDSRKKNLGKNDAKFYSGSINFSQEELAFLNNDKAKIKNYVCEVFRLYAANFNREGLNIDNINWFGKLEDNRYYKGTDQEVIEGKNKVGDIKPELNTHVHFIVGRKSVDNQLKLSPKTNHRSTKSGAVKGGFDRERFIIGCEKLFDEMFQYNRPEEHTYKYQNEIKNGDSDVKYNNIATSESKRISNKKYYQLTDAEKEKKLLKLINFIQFGYKEERYPLDKNQILDKAKQLNWNGDIHRSLLNLNQRIKQGRALERDVTGFVLNYVDFLNKPYKELPNSIKEDRLLNYVQMLNSKKPERYIRLDPLKLIDAAKQRGFNGSVLRGLNRLNYSLKQGIDIGEDLNLFVLQLDGADNREPVYSSFSQSDFITPVFNSIKGILGSVNESPSDDDDLFFKKKKKRKKLYN